MALLELITWWITYSHTLFLAMSSSGKQVSSLSGLQGCPQTVQILCVYNSKHYDSLIKIFIIQVNEQWVNT